MELRQFSRVRAVFSPLRTDDLKPETFGYIGQTFDWEALWIIENGDYDGQFAMGFDRAILNHPYTFNWVPQCDLNILEVLEY